MYDTRTVVIRLIMPDGYYDEDDDLTEDGRAVLIQILEDEGITVDTIEQ